MAESNRKCSRLGEWFVQEEIARAIDTALETIIGLSKRKQFKYHGGESLFALDFHTEKHTSSLLPLFPNPPPFILEGRVDTGIASLSSKSLLPCALRMISKWFVCIERECNSPQCACLCRRESLLYFPGIWNSGEEYSQTDRVCVKAESLLFKSTVSLLLSSKPPHSAGFFQLYPLSHSRRDWPEKSHLEANLVRLRRLPLTVVEVWLSP